MIKKLVIIILVVFIPAILFFQVWQVMRYKTLNNEVKGLEVVQEEWIEKNKQILAKIAELRAPDRIERIVKEDIGLDIIDYKDVLNIKIFSGREE